MAQLNHLETTISRLLVEGLELEESPKEIESQNLFGVESCGLDSVDLIAAVVLVERHFKFEFPPETDFAEVFQNISSIAQAVCQFATFAE